MSTSQILKHLYSLDVSSPEIPRLLDDLIQCDEEERVLSSLRGPELTQLVDFLDQVRAPFGLPSGYETDSAGPQRHPNYRRRFPTMFVKATGHLWRQYGPTVLVHRIQ